MLQYQCCLLRLAVSFILKSVATTFVYFLVYILVTTSLDMWKGKNKYLKQFVELVEIKCEFEEN